MPSSPTDRHRGRRSHDRGTDLAGAHLAATMACACCGRRCAAHAMTLRNARHLCGACGTASARAEDGARQRSTIAHWPFEREVPRLAGRRSQVARDVAKVDAIIFGVLLAVRIGVYGMLAHFAAHLPPAQAFLAGLLLGDLISWPVRAWLDHRDGEPLNLGGDATTYAVSIGCWLLAGQDLGFAADSASQSSGWLGMVTGFYAGGIGHRLERSRAGIF